MRYKETACKKLNLGASAGWANIDGWESLDHKRIDGPGLRTQAWRIPYADGSFEAVFSSHTFEHISHFKIEEVLCELNRVMKKDGVLRVLTPDLKRLAEAYVNGDSEAMRRYIKEDDSGINTDLGLGQAFMNFMVSGGSDNYLLASDYSSLIAGYAHLYCYDYDMLSGLLERHGFYKIRRCSADDSDIAEHKELRTVAHDRDEAHSLIVECRKREYIPFSPESCILYSERAAVPRRYSAHWFLFRLAGYCYTVAAYLASRLPAPLKRRVKRVLSPARSRL